MPYTKVHEEWEDVPSVATPITAAALDQIEEGIATAQLTAELAEGTPGPEGPEGPAGADGLSAYEIAVAGGFVGDEAAWLASLEGPAGENGIDGAPGAPGVVQTIVAGTNVSVDSTDPANPVVSATGGGGGTGTVESIVAGDNITVDATDPANPIISATGGGLSLDLPAVLPFTSTSQRDGVFGFLGSAGFAFPYGNPAVGSAGGLIHTPSASAHYTPTQSSNIDTGRTAGMATDGTVYESHTGNSAGEWWMADFGEDRTVQVTHVGICGRQAAGEQPRNFKIQESNDGSTWTDLLVVTGAGPSALAWWDSDVSGATPSRYIRILSTGANSNGSNYLVLGEVEFWGTYDAA